MLETTARALSRVARRLYDAKAERDRLIVQASAEGASSREIAEVAGITHAGVQKVLHKMAPVKRT